MVLSKAKHQVAAANGWVTRRRNEQLITAHSLHYEKEDAADQSSDLALTGLPVSSALETSNTQIDCLTST